MRIQSLSEHSAHVTGSVVLNMALKSQNEGLLLETSSKARCRRHDAHRIAVLLKEGANLPQTSSQTTQPPISLQPKHRHLRLYIHLRQIPDWIIISSTYPLPPFQNTHPTPPTPLPLPPQINCAPLLPSCKTPPPEVRLTFPMQLVRFRFHRQQRVAYRPAQCWWDWISSESEYFF